VPSLATSPRRGLFTNRKPGFATGLPTGDVDPEALPQASLPLVTVHLSVQPAEEPDQQDNWNWDADQPQE
jgi:hypothetical protein